MVRGAGCGVPGVRVRERWPGCGEFPGGSGCDYPLLLLSSVQTLRTASSHTALQANLNGGIQWRESRVPHLNGAPDILLQIPALCAAAADKGRLPRNAICDVMRLCAGN